MFIKLLIISLFFMAIAFAALGIRVLIKSHGRFPETHVSRNKEMRRLGITCAQQTDIGCNPSNDFDGCSTCAVRKL